MEAGVSWSPCVSPQYRPLVPFNCTIPYPDRHFRGGSWPKVLIINLMVFCEGLVHHEMRERHRWCIATVTVGGWHEPTWVVC